MDINDFVYFDALFLTHEIEQRCEYALRSEIHLFGYLSCLLALYEGIPVAQWEYKFGITEYSRPFSVELDSAIDKLIIKGKISNLSEQLSIPSHVAKELEGLSKLRKYQQRMRHMNGACTSLLALPVGVIRNALSQDIELKAAIELARTQFIPSKHNESILYKQFSQLSQALGSVKELMIPSVVWLTYLSQQIDDDSKGLKSGAR